MKINRKSGFTLIELVIVVAIIAILSVIGLVNYQHAQVKAKLSRAKAEMMTLVTGLECYYVDYNAYPRWAQYADIRPFPPVSIRFAPLTTPISYLGSIPRPDPFYPKAEITGLFGNSVYDTYDYIDAESSAEVKGETNYNIGRSLYGRMYRIASCGPDRDQTYGRSEFTGTPPNITWTKFGFYDPANGTVSGGDIVRLGPPSNYFTGLQLPFDPQM